MSNKFRPAGGEPYSDKPKLHPVLLVKKKRTEGFDMTGNLLFFSIVSILLPILIGYSVLRSRKQGKTLADTMVNHAILIVIWMISLREVWKETSGITGMTPFDKYLFVGIVVFLVIPLTVYAILVAKQEMPKFYDVKAYKHPFLYRFRHVLALVPWIVLCGAFYVYYRIYLILFS
jgi:hypothetical protein